MAIVSIKAANERVLEAFLSGVSWVNDPSITILDCGDTNASLDCPDLPKDQSYMLTADGELIG